jgi:hypothetical protein
MKAFAEHVSLLTNVLQCVGEAASAIVCRCGNPVSGEQRVCCGPTLAPLRSGRAKGFLLAVSPSRAERGRAVGYRSERWTEVLAAVNYRLLGYYKAV